ncbi:MAG: porin family protein [Bacteroidota bacterium]
MELLPRMDKNQGHIDQDFLDESWANMAELLDKEMPLKKRKRRFFWLWFGGLAASILLAMGGTYHFFYNDQADFSLNQKEVIKTPSAMAGKKSIESAEQLLKNKPTTSTSEPLVKSLTTTKPTFDSPASSNRAAEKLTKIATTEASDEAILTENTVTIPSKIKEQLTYDSRTETTDELISTESEGSTSQLPILTLSPISTLSFTPLRAQKTVEAIPFNRKKSNTWHWGFYSGLHYPKLGSFSAGISTTKTFHPRWSFQVGLGYARSVLQLKYSSSGDQTDPMPPVELEQTAIPDPDSTGLATAEPDPDMDNNAGEFDPITNNAAGQGTTRNVNLSFNSFHYIELPILIQYRFQPRWRVELGGKISRLYGYSYQSADSRPTFANNLGIFNAKSEDLLENADASYHSSIADAAIKSWEWAVLGGLSYQIQPNWQIYSQYHFGLNNYLDISDSDGRNARKWRRMELGVRFSFR